jgi:hypothetical protein
MRKITLRLTEEDLARLERLTARANERRRARPIPDSLRPLSESAMLLLCARHGLVDFEAWDREADRKAADRKASS